jgi:nucleotide-binding universal stress UspA family protein
VSVHRRILVGYVDTERGRDALALGRVLCRADDAEMVVATAPDEDGRDLPSLARLHRADLVVLGSTHRGPVGRVVPGAAVERLLGEPPCAVAVAPPGFAQPKVDGDSGWRPLGGEDEDAGLRVIGVGYDGSPAAQEALRLAVDLAIPSGATLRVYAIARKYPQVPGAAAAGAASPVPTEAGALNDLLHRAVRELPAEVRALPVFLRGFPVGELVNASEAGVDLLVLGCRAGGPVRRMLHHSVTAAVLEAAKCPVLIAPLGVAAPTAAMA